MRCTWHPGTDDLGRYLGVPTTHGKVNRMTINQAPRAMEKQMSLFSGATNSYFVNYLCHSVLYNANNSTISFNCDDVDRKIRRFLRSGTSLQRRIHLAPWPPVTQKKEMGALRIPAMRTLNKASLMKLGWRIVLEPNKVWARVLAFKYFGGASTTTRLPPKSHHCSTRRGIVQ